MNRRLALVRPPGPRLAEGIVTHLDRTPIDLDLARAQWDAYVAALRLAGWTCLEVAPADDCPDAAFVEDAAVVYGDQAVITRPGAEIRRGETPAVEAALRECGYRIARIEEPGTLDGGDVSNTTARHTSVSVVAPMVLGCNNLRAIGPSSACACRPCRSSVCCT